MKLLIGTHHPSLIIITSCGLTRRIFFLELYRRLTETIMFCHFGVKLRIPEKNYVLQLFFSQGTLASVLDNIMLKRSEF